MIDINVFDMAFELDDSSNWPKDLIGIYIIWSKSTNKRYVGMTKHKRGFYGRWQDHTELLKDKEHDNPYLQHSYNKHGKSDFYMQILEICDRTITKKELELKEWVWIDKMEAMFFQKGWNIDTHERYEKRKVCYRPSYKEKSMDFQFIDPNGNVIKGNNLVKFAKENNLDSGNLNRVFNGKQYSHKGYKSTNPEFHRKFEIYKLVSPDGVLYEFSNIKKFQKEHNLSNLKSVFCYKFKQIKGWYMPDILEKVSCPYHHPAKIKRVINLDTFKIHEFKNIDIFCEKYNLNQAKLLSIINPSPNKDTTIKHKNWAHILSPVKAVEKDGIVYRFIWAIEIEKVIGVSSCNISNIWSGKTKIGRFGVKKAEPFPLEVIQESF